MMVHLSQLNNFTIKEFNKRLKHLVGLSIFLFNFTIKEFNKRLKHA